MAVDVYSKAPIDKFSMLKVIKENFGLNYAILPISSDKNGLSCKPYYYSLSKKAKNFGFMPKFTSLETILFEINQFNSLKNA